MLLDDILQKGLLILYTRGWNVTNDRSKHDGYCKSAIITAPQKINPTESKSWTGNSNLLDCGEQKKKLKNPKRPGAVIFDRRWLG